MTRISAWRSKKSSGTPRGSWRYIVFLPLLLGGSAQATLPGDAAARDPFHATSGAATARAADQQNRAASPSEAASAASTLRLEKGKGLQTVSLYCASAPLRQVLQALAAHRQVDLIVGPGVEGTLTLQIRDMSWQHILERVVSAGGLHLERHGRTLIVSSLAGLAVRQQEEQQIQDQLEQSAPLLNRMLTLQHADAAEIFRSFDAQRKSLLSPRGSIRLDKRTNSLVLRDTAAALAAVADWVAIWDVPLEQVVITAHIVTISRDNLREVGVNWRYPAAAYPEDARMSMNMPLGEHYARMGFRLARLSGRLLELELTALEQENKVDILASPRLYTAHQQTASIKQGTEIPYQVAGGRSKTPSIQFKEAVLCMEVTPRILRNGRINLDIRLSQNVPGRTMKQGPNESVSIEMEEIKTQVTIANGETIVLGGIFQHQQHQTEDRVPLLASLPLMGELFKRQRAHYKQRELVIFITPTRISG